MSDVIDFMEKMGGDSQLSQASTDELAAALSATDIAPELQSAVLGQDAQRLGALLGTKPACPMVAPPGPPPGPPGHPGRPGHPGPSPARPPAPPLPKKKDGEDEGLKDCSEHDGVGESPTHRREPPSA